MAEGLRTIERLPEGWQLVIDQSEPARVGLTVASAGGNAATFHARGEIVRQVLSRLADEAGCAAGTCERVIGALPPGWFVVVDDRVSREQFVSMEVLMPTGSSAWISARSSNARGVLLALADAAGAAPGERPGITPQP